MSPSVDKSSWFARVFEPKTDFFALLNIQSATTLDGIIALEQWINEGTFDRCQKVRDLENDADEHKLELERKLVESFVTPFDREDIHDLSVKLDEVINGAKATVREMEALDFKSSDPFLKEMAATLVEGTRCLNQAFNHLQNNAAEASNQASLARKSEKRFAKIYRQAMKNLFTLDDFKTLLKTREVYICMVSCATKIDIVGEKLLHVIVKTS
ncbi:MAG: DUF47 family protein [Cyanobacteria bacterium SZAS LIN-5]|nr:DUF47 family protein [Cyanobacteria bacterium SZAS LIN-5]